MNRLLLVLHFMLLGILPGMARQQYGVSIPELQRSLGKSTTDTGKTRLSLAIAEVYIRLPGAGQKDMDSAFLYLKKASALNTYSRIPRWEARSYYLQSKAYREKGLYTEGKAVIIKARQILTSLHYPGDMADVLMETGHYYSIDVEDELKEKIHLYENAAAQYRMAGNTAEEAYAYKMTGDCYHCWGKYDEALLYLNKTLTLYKNTGRKDLQGIYDLLGTIATGKGDYSQGLTYGLLALKTAEEQKDSSLQLCTILNRLSVTLYELGDYQHALDFAQRSLKIANYYKDTTAILTVSTNFITIYLRDNQPAKALELLNRIVELYKEPIQKDRIWISTNLIRCYVQLQQLDKAAAFVPGLLTISANMSRYNYYQTMIYSALVMYYIHAKQFEKAAGFCALQAEVCKQIGQLNGLSHNYLQWFRADSALGNYPAAIRHYKDYKVLNDSLFRISKAGEIARLQVQYDFDQKNKDITLKQQNIELLTRQGLLQRAALKEARLTRNIIIFGAVMLLLLLILSYNRYQLKQASNKRLQQKQEEIYLQNQSLQGLIDVQEKLLEEKEWLVKEIHHRVRNNLQIVMSLLNTQAAYLHNSDALEAISESRYRMQAISLIHQKLYLSANMALIDMQNYIRELIAGLKDDFGGLQHLYFDINIAPVKLDVSQAVPVSLILNEALTNAIKYAFPKNENGIIYVSLQYTGEAQLLLRVADSGHGFPAGFDVYTHGTMGIRLIETLTEQLEGSLEIKETPGVAIQVSFKQQKS